MRKPSSMRSAKARRAVVIGSSFIGLEVAASLRARNLEVDVVSLDSVPLERILGAQVGRFVQKLHEEKGVRFHLGAKLRAIHADAVELEDGRRLAADVVVLGVGVKPRTELAKRAGLRSTMASSSIRSCAPARPTSGPRAISRVTRSRDSGPCSHRALGGGRAAGAERGGGYVRTRAALQRCAVLLEPHYDVTLSYVGHAGGDAETEVIGQPREARCDGGVPGRRKSRRGAHGGARPAESRDRGRARKQGLGRDRRAVARVRVGELRG